MTTDSLMQPTDLETTFAEFRKLEEACQDKAQVARLQKLQQLLSRAMIYTSFVAGKIATDDQDDDGKKQDGPTHEQSDESAEGTDEGFHQPKIVTGTTLRDYQLDGVRWLSSLYENGLNGILADEMGLGKTCQCISFLAFLFERGVKGPFLVAAPLSTIANWENEFKRFAPTIPVMLYHGTKDERTTMRMRKLKAKQNEWPVIITSYEIIMNDAKYFAKTFWKYLIVDEGHRIKNLNCKLIQTLKSMRTANRLLLTGTPLQNNLLELWSLLNFLLPEIFDDVDAFESWFDFSELDNMADETGTRAAQEVISNLHRLLKPFVLRRLKTDINLKIPPKREYLLYASMTPMQEKYYRALLKKDLHRCLNASREALEAGDIDFEYEDRNEPDPNEEEKQAAKRKRTTGLDEKLIVSEKRQRKDVSYDEDDDEAYFDNLFANDNDDENANTLNVALTGSKAQNQFRVGTIRNLIMHLKKCCNHPFLFEFPADAEGEPIINDKLVTASGKMIILDRLLGELIKRDHKILVFSQMTTMLDIIETYLETKDIECRRIDGNIPYLERQKSINDFNGDESVKVFLLSTRAGGLGINLTAADSVIIYDSDWNPTADMQAMDRCHRLGQTRPVVVYRLAVRNSVELRILEKAASKRRLEQLVMHKRKFKKVETKEKPIDLKDLQDILVADQAFLKSNQNANENDGSMTEWVIDESMFEALLDRSEEAYQAKAGPEDEGNGVFKLMPTV